MKTQTIVAILASISLFACDTALIQPQTPQKRLTLECNEGSMIQGHWQGDNAVLEIDGTKTILPHVVSASGARYANSEYDMWIKGAQAILTRSQQPNNVIKCNVH